MRDCCPNCTEPKASSSKLPFKLCPWKREKKKTGLPLAVRDMTSYIFIFVFVALKILYERDKYRCFSEKHEGNATISSGVSRWYFDLANMKCLEFTYYGNISEELLAVYQENNFESEENCRKACPGGFKKMMF